MKIESSVKINSGTSRFEVYPDGNESAAIFHSGCKVMSIGRIRIGKFDESLGLVEKLRKHLATDMLSAEADSENVIPFGCEYRIKRHWKFSGNCGELTDDISADNGGRINDLALEEIVFSGKVHKVEYFLAGDDDVKCVSGEKTVYDGDRQPLFVRVFFIDGLLAEFYCGDDFWRHRCAADFSGGSSRHLIVADENSVRWTRQILTLPEEVIPEKRPWRFKMLFAISRATDITEPVSATEFALSGCFAAPAMHRQFRDFVRKNADKGNIRLKISGDICCFDGSHVSRPGKKLAHGMLGELFDEYIWASTFLKRHGALFTMDIDCPQLSDSPATANLRIPAAVMEPVETEEL